MDKPKIKELAEDVVNQWLNESEETYYDPDAVFKVTRKHLSSLSHVIYSVMLEIHGDGIREGKAQSRQVLGELLDLPARVAELERREEIRRESEMGD